MGFPIYLGHNETREDLGGQRQFWKDFPCKTHAKGYRKILQTNVSDEDYSATESYKFQPQASSIIHQQTKFELTLIEKMSKTLLNKANLKRNSCKFHATYEHKISATRLAVFFPSSRSMLVNNMMFPKDWSTKHQNEKN